MDRTELERELERLHLDAWGWALACTGRDRTMAEDALQNAYLRVLSGVARFDGRSRFKSWLFGVIRMTALEEVRGAYRRRARAGDAAAVEPADPAPGADVIAEESERATALVVAMRALSPRQREVLQLVFYNGMTIEEAANVLRIAIGSARTHYERGKKALAEQINHVDVR